MMSNANSVEKIQKILEKNWEEVKAEMRHAWRNLSDNDVAGINSYDDLVKKLKKVYSLSEEEVIEKINKFIDKLDLQPNLSRFEEFTTAFADDAKDKIGRVIKDSKDVIQEKTGDWTEHLSTLVKENPLKALGLGVLVTLAIKKLLVTKKED